MEITQQQIQALEAYDDKYMTKSDAQTQAIRIARRLGIPESMQGEFASVILKIYEITIKVKNEVVAFGRILINKLIEFIKENKKVIIGAFIGFIFGIALSFIPFIGPIIANFAPLLGAAYMKAKEMGENGKIDASESTLGKLFEGATAVVLDFCKLVKDIYNAYMESRKAYQ